MSKKVIPDHPMDRERLTELVRIALDDMTYVELADMSGIGPTVISKLAKGTFASDPIPNTLLSISRASNGRVKPEDILEAGGYDPHKYMVESDGETNPNEYRDNVTRSIERAYRDNGRKWEDINYGMGKLYQLSGHVTLDSPDYGHSAVTVYFIYLQDHSSNKQVIKNKLVSIYGNLSFQILDPNLKICIVTNNPAAYKVALAYPPYAFSSYTMSVVLTDSTGSELIKEEYLNNILRRENQMDSEVLDVLRVVET